jgi:hypothetical protein
MDVEVKVMVPEELKAIGDVLLGITAGLKAKQSPLVLLASLEPQILLAVQKSGELSGDLKDEHVYEFAGLFAGQLAKILLQKPAAPVAP